MYDDNEMGLPKVYEDDTIMIFFINDDDTEEKEESEDSEETESMEKDSCPHKKTHQGISQFSMPVMSDKIERLLLSIIGA